MGRESREGLRVRRTCGSVRKSLSSWPARALFCRPAAAGARIGKGGRGRAHTERGHEVVVHQTDQVARASARRQPENAKQARVAFGGVRARLHDPPA